MYKASKSKYVDNYVERMCTTMHMLNPDWNPEDVEDVVRDMVKKEFQNPVVTMDNNYTGEQKEASLVSVFDWALDKRPIIAGNGTFYKNQYQELNPVAVMLDNMLIARKKIKKQMFLLDDDISNEYQDLDRGQKNEKINVNSYYGASGASSSAFYSKWSGPATTLSAQQIISTTESTFEAFVADNYDFLNMNEFFDWIHSFLLDAPVIIDDWVKPVSAEKLFKRLKEKIRKLKSADKEVLETFCYNLDETERKIVYYKNNLIQFVKDHKKISNLYESIFESIPNYEYHDHNDSENSIRKSVILANQNPEKIKTAEDWNKFVNKQYFMDPNDVPNTIKDKVEKLSEYLVEYVYTPYMPFERVYRLKNFKRRTVTVIDTDSNILALDTWVNFTLDEVLTSNYGRDKMKNVFISVNTLTYVLTQVVRNILLQYGEYSNVPEEFRPRLNMKNELTRGSFKTPLIAGKNLLDYKYQVMVA